MNKTTCTAALAIAVALLCGCLNMPTPPSQITAAPNSGVSYESYSLRQLQIELDHLVQYEAQLIVAQDQRIKTSKTQAFWHGYGTGDGIEASQLAVTRGQIDAVKKAIAEKTSNPR